LHALKTLEDGFDLPVVAPGADAGALGDVLQQVATRMQDNFPYFHPLYAGQMLKPPHAVARAAYMLAMWINPNNHALDGGRASSQMEKEAVADLARMFGYTQHLGHLTGGGTMANLEALWVAGKSHPGKLIVASDQAHYTHQRISDVLGLPFQKVPSDALGRMDVGALETLLKTGDVGTVVCTMGTTGLGAVDPLDGLLELQKSYGFRIHADAAYGGYFRLATNLRDETSSRYALLHHTNSLVIDPHKHGLQPYGCGCILFRDPSVARHYLHDSPYTYFTSNELHLGEISLECSRPGAAAVALWATHQVLPPVSGGAFAADLEKCRRAALELYRRIQGDARFVPVLEPELDIVVWGVKAASTSAMSEKAQHLFDEAAKKDLHLSLLKLPAAKLPLSGVQVDTPTVTCLRSCLMKPEHEAWLDEIWKRI
jgi:tyrosine decarboxylase / aspartate 1-decarboxylase